MRTIWIFVSILCITLSSCRQVECSGFPDNQLSWVKYETHDTIAFKSAHDTLASEVVSHYSSDNYSYKKNCDCECTASASYETELNKNDFKIIAECSYYTENNIRITYTFQSILAGDNFSFEFDNSLMEYRNISGVTDYLLGNTTLTNVGFVDIQTNQEVVKIYFTKEKGLIGFTDKNGIEWSLIE